MSLWYQFSNYEILSVCSKISSLISFQIFRAVTVDIIQGDRLTGDDTSDELSSAEGPMGIPGSRIRHHQERNKNYLAPETRLEDNTFNDLDSLSSGYHSNFQFDRNSL